MLFIFKKASKQWTEEEIQELLRRFRTGDTIDRLSHYFSRSRSDIRSKLESLFRIMLQNQELYIVAKKLDIPYIWIRTLLYDKK